MKIKAPEASGDDRQECMKGRCTEVFNATEIWLRKTLLLSDFSTTDLPWSHRNYVRDKIKLSHVLYRKWWYFIFSFTLMGLCNGCKGNQLFTLSSVVFVMVLLSSLAVLPFLSFFPSPCSLPCLSSVPINVCVCVCISEWLTVSETVVWSLSTRLWCLLACLVYLCRKCTSVFYVWVPVEKILCWGRARFTSTWELLSSLWSTLCLTVVALYSL